MNQDESNCKINEIRNTRNLQLTTIRKKGFMLFIFQRQGTQAHADKQRKQSTDYTKLKNTFRRQSQKINQMIINRMQNISQNA